MTQELLDTDIDLDWEDSDIGRMYLFCRTDALPNDVLSFSSTLENVGQLDKHDRSIKNNTKVMVISEPVEAHHPKHGTILVSRIIAHQIMWVGTVLLFPIDKA